MSRGCLGRSRQDVTFFTLSLYLVDHSVDAKFPSYNSLRDCISLDSLGINLSAFSILRRHNGCSITCPIESFTQGQNKGGLRHDSEEMYARIFAVLRVFALHHQQGCACSTSSAIDRRVRQ